MKPTIYNTLKKKIETALVVGALTLFASVTLIFILDLIGLKIPNRYGKPTVITLSIIAVLWYLMKSILKAKKEELKTKASTVTHNFSFKYYCYENLSNTEYTIFAFETFEGNTIMMFTDELNPHELMDALKIEVFEGKVISIENYSTGRQVELIDSGTKLSQVFDYDNDNELYKLEKSITNLLDL